MQGWRTLPRLGILATRWYVLRKLSSVSEQGCLARLDTFRDWGFLMAEILFCAACAEFKWIGANRRSGMLYPETSGGVSWNLQMLLDLRAAAEPFSSLVPASQPEPQTRAAGR